MPTRPFKFKMAKIQRTTVTGNAERFLGIQGAADVLPTNSSNIIAPVVEVGAKFSKILKQAASTTTGTSVIYTTPTDKDFYLTGAWLSWAASAAHDGTEFAMYVYVGGSNIRIISQALLATTANVGYSSKDLNFPLLLDRGSQIYISSSFAAGALKQLGGITGFIYE